VAVLLLAVAGEKERLRRELLLRTNQKARRKIKMVSSQWDVVANGNFSCQFNFASAFLNSWKWLLIIHFVIKNKDFPHNKFAIGRFAESVLFAMASNSGFYGSNTGVCVYHVKHIWRCTCLNHFLTWLQKDTTFRRTWDKEEYAAKAKEREQADKLAEENEERKAKGPQRELLKAREEKVVLDANLNKTQVVSVGAAGPASKQPGFYCKTCDCVIKDSANYLDHINGKKRMYHSDTICIVLLLSDTVLHRSKKSWYVYEGGARHTWQC
jgi:hypothetical protein